MIAQLKAALFSLKGLALVGSVVVIGGVITYQHYALCYERDRRYAAETELHGLRKAFEDIKQEHKKQLAVITQEVEHERKRAEQVTATIKNLQQYKDGDVSPALRYAIDSLYVPDSGTEDR